LRKANESGEYLHSCLRPQADLERQCRRHRPAPACALPRARRGRSSAVRARAVLFHFLMSGALAPTLSGILLVRNTLCVRTVFIIALGLHRDDIPLTQHSPVYRRITGRRQPQPMKPCADSSRTRSAAQFVVPSTKFARQHISRVPAFVGPTKVSREAHDRLRACRWR